MKKHTFNKTNILNKKGRQCPFKSLITHCDQETAKMLSNYYNHLLYERNYSINTINGYFYDIKMLLLQVSQNFQHKIINLHFFDDLNPNHIRTFLFSSNLHKNSMKRFFSSIRSLLSYLISQKFISKNEILNMEQGKGEKKLPHPIDYENIMKIIQKSQKFHVNDLNAEKALARISRASSEAKSTMCLLDSITETKLISDITTAISINTNTKMETPVTSKNNSHYNKNRNEFLYSTIFTTIYGMGLRISELINLTIHDFIMMKIEKKIKILGKGQKDRIIPVIRSVEKTITQYMRNEFANFLQYKDDNEFLNFLQNNIPKNEPIFTIHRIRITGLSERNDVNVDDLGADDNADVHCVSVLERINDLNVNLKLSQVKSESNVDLEMHRQEKLHVNTQEGSEMKAQKKSDLNAQKKSKMNHRPGSQFNSYIEESSIAIPIRSTSTKPNANIKIVPKANTNVSDLVSQKLSPSTIQKNMKRILKNLNINNKFTPHSLRHSFASHMIENGAELRYIQELLGHSSAKSTQAYTQINTKILTEHIQNIHPRNKSLSKNALIDKKNAPNNNQNSNNNKDNKGCKDD